MLKRQAVLFRSSHHRDLLELELVRRNIPYVKYGGLKFLEAAHVKDMLAVLRWADNSKNRMSAFRALQLLRRADRGRTPAAICGDDARKNRAAPDCATALLRHAAIAEAECTARGCGGDTEKNVVG